MSKEEEQKKAKIIQESSIYIESQKSDLKLRWNQDSVPISKKKTEDE